MTEKKVQPRRGRGKAEGKGKVNHALIAWALAGVLAAAPESIDARAIVDAANKLGAAIGEAETYDLRAEIMLRGLLDAGKACAYDLDGQDRAKGRRAYHKLVALAGGAEGSPEPEDKKSCAWLCWTVRRLRAALTAPTPERFTEEEYREYGKPRMEIGVLIHVVEGASWRDLNVPAVLQMLAPLVRASQRPASK
jgi:hypothetical protein